MSVMRKMADGKGAGFTLIEVLVGLVIFSVGALGFVSMLIMQIKGNRSARNTNEIATMTQSAIENLSGVCWDFLGSDTASPSSNGLTAADVDTQGPLNRLGQTSGTGTGPYFFYKHVVICTSATLGVAAGASPLYCGSTVSGVNRPPELACNTLALSAREKMMRVMLTWSDNDGQCHWKHLDALAFDWDGATGSCP